MRYRNMQHAREESEAEEFSKRRSTDLLAREIDQFSKAATSGQGNRKQRRQMQAELKKMMRKH
ncbi:hypothetical protein [Mesorhizobium sp.]|uniref:hypothetical protein n=1 Tax=Mesorhizobium sp. TaxID=1871066 RepID=UPI0025CFED5C|nr:hypothetical protein [Mesorhizobium sp.]